MSATAIGVARPLRGVVRPPASSAGHLVLDASRLVFEGMRAVSLPVCWSRRLLGLDRAYSWMVSILLASYRGTVIPKMQAEGCWKHPPSPNSDQGVTRMAKAARKVHCLSKNSIKRRRLREAVYRAVAALAQEGIEVRLSFSLTHLVYVDEQYRMATMSDFVLLALLARVRECDRTALREYLFNTGRIDGWSNTMKALLCRSFRHPDDSAERIALAA